MNRPLILELNLLTTTPAFLGNAEGMAELRPQSFKGLLRHWHRAIDGNIVKQDAENGCRGSGLDDGIWGGAGDNYGQSKVLLRIRPPGKLRTWRWNKKSFNRFSRGHGRNIINGILYLGYPFNFEANADRTALADGTVFTLQGVVPEPDTMDEEEIRGILAAFWLLAMFGSCGSRSRRGFGSLQGQGWRLDNPGNNPLWKHLFGRLPSPGLANSPEDWRREYEQGLLVMANWFPRFPDNCAHNHIGLAFSPVLLPPSTSWQEALNQAGEKMQMFRRRMQPDYDRVRNLLNNPGASKHEAPQRTSFGLPLIFRFTSGPNRGPVTFNPVRPASMMAAAPQRFASPLYIKIIRLGMRYYPLLFLLQGQEPGTELAVQPFGRGIRAGAKQTDKSAVSEFFKLMRGENMA